MESQHYTELKEIVDKYAFLIHEEYMTYKHIKHAHMDEKIKPIWIDRYRKVWWEINRWKTIHLNDSFHFKITTILGDIVEFKPGTGYLINGWI